jgi:DNA-binding NarL/FixJ family response regulator
MHNDIHFVAEMLNAGASGYLLKDCAFEELIHAIFVVAEQATYLSPKITIPSGCQPPLPADAPAKAERGEQIETTIAGSSPGRE